MGLDAQVTYFLFKRRVLLVALGDDQRIDTFADNRFPTAIVMKIDGVAIRAKETGIGNHLNTKFVHDPGLLICMLN